MAAETDTDTTEPKTKGAKGRTGARARIEVEGDIDQTKVSDVLDAAGRGGRGRRDAASSADPDQKFARVVRNPRNKIIAARLQPQTMSDGTPLNDTLELPCHEGQSIEEIKRDIAEARGGRKWIIRVFDNNEDVVASRAESIGGMPRMDPMLEGMETQEEQPMESQTEMTDAEVLERTLAADPDVVKAQKKLRLKQIAAEEEEEDAKMEEVRARRALAQRAAKGEGENGNGNGKHKHADEEDEAQSKLMKAIELANAPLKEANAALQRRLDDAEKRNFEKESKAEQQRMIEAQTGPLKEMLAAQKTAMDQMMAKLNADSTKGASSDTILAKLDAMKSEIKGDTKDQIIAVVGQLTSKIDTVASTLNTYMSKGSDPATNALIALATSGNKGGAAPVDPYQGLERALKALQNLKSLTTAETVSPPDFPSYLVEKVAETTPEVLNFFKEQRGAVPTKEEIEKMMRGAAMKMYDGLDASWKTRMTEEFARLRQQQGLPPVAAPAASPAGTPAPAAPQVTVQPTAQPGAAPSVVAFPGSAAPAAAPAAATAPAAPAAPIETTLTPDQLFQSLSAENKAEYTKRINHVLGGLAREMEIGVQAMGWPEQAQAHLPKAIIDQLVDATKDSEIHDIVKNYAKPELMDKIWGYLSPSNKNHEWYQGWLAQGINWIKEANGVEIVEEGEPPVVEDSPG